MKRLFALLLCVAMLLSMCACGGKKPPEPSLDLEDLFGAFSLTYSLEQDEDPSKVFLTEEAAQKVEQTASEVAVPYEFEDLYDLSQCMECFAHTPQVTAHAASVLDANGQLTVQGLMDTVKSNNRQRMEEDDFLMELPSDEYLQDICQLIVMTVKELFDRYPAIDRERVYCNLGNLKILYKSGMLEFAMVTPEMVLNISDSSAQIVGSLYHKDAYRNTLIHETVHIVQLGCHCEALPQVDRRCGFAYNRTDLPKDMTDNTWLPEGSAERLSSLLTGDDPFTYLYMIDYLKTMNLATMLAQDVPPHYTESLSFYDNIDVLFDLFGCRNDEERREVLSMLISVNLIQIQPEGFYKAYDEVYGTDTLNVEDDMTEVFRRLKPSIAMTFSKRFYVNLAQTLVRESDVTAEDVCYLIRLFEAALNGHMSYTDESRMAYHREFFEQYSILRGSFFEALKVSCGVDPEMLYRDYRMVESEDSQTVNASLKWLEEEKVRMLLERTQNLSDLTAKIP